LLLGFVACASSSDLIDEVMDPVTAVTVTICKVPLLFYRDTPSRAAHARDYLNVGAIEVNRSGSYQYFLWAGMWGTMQANDATEQRDSLESLVLFADGEPLNLELAGWTPATIGTSDHVYVRPVAEAIDAYYQVSADQIRLIAGAKSIRIQTTGSSPRNYELWDEQQTARLSLEAFLENSLF
jgi:hypothetical protein